MLPDVTQSFKLKRPGLESCTVGLKCLSLSIILLYKNMQPFERHRQELCVTQKTG